MTISMKDLLLIALAYLFGIITPILFYFKIVSGLAILDTTMALYVLWFYEEGIFSWKKLSGVFLKLVAYLGILSSLYYAHIALQLPTVELAGSQVTLATMFAGIVLVAELKSIGDKWKRLYGYNPFEYIFSIFGFLGKISDSMSNQTNQTPKN